MATITFIGLGPGDPTYVTRAAWALLETAQTIYTPVPSHPVLAELSRTRLHPLLDKDLPATVATLVGQAAADGDVVCALPGHPRDHTLLTTVQAIESVHVRVVPGISLIDTFCDALAIDRQHIGVQIIAAAALLAQDSISENPTEPAWCELQGVGTYTPPIVPYPLVPTQPALIWCSGTCNGNALLAMLQLRYPATHTLRLVQLDLQGNTTTMREISLETLSHELPQAEPMAIYLPPLLVSADRRSLEGLEWVVARLLGPGGCPWDREQTHQSLRAGLLEEAYEVLEALDTDDMQILAEELGDLLLQAIIHSEMARQGGYFTLRDVIEQVTTKLIRRHPHVFDDLVVDGSGTVIANWEQIKAQELAEKGRSRASVLDGIPTGLPALTAAQKMIAKATRVGFEWNEIDQVFDKVHEELAELAQAYAYIDESDNESRQHLDEEFGDLLFATANLALWLGMDAESMLREASAKFRRRFTYVEQAARDQGRSLSDMAKSEMLALWLQAKTAT